MSSSDHRKTRKVFNTPGEAHELTFSCFHRRKFLCKDRTRQYFVQAVRAARRIHQFHLWAYGIMPEHVHMIVFPPEEQYDMGAIQKPIKQSVAGKAINFLKRENPEGLKLLETGLTKEPYHFWLAGGGYDRNVITYPTLEHMVNYTHNNPVRRGLVDDPADWKWSSYNEWKNPGSGPLSLDLDSFPYL
ncbi:MAG: transposase [Candidatus Hydrogenedentes bacterium]|nr:transposase [Candidatus Hydrogenedentota bacterium]